MATTNTNNDEGRPNIDRHCSHEHPLEATQFVETGSNTRCSGCNLQIFAGRDYYTCRTCSFHLHRTCFNLPDLLQHQGHPNHHLTLTLFPSFHCKACNGQGAGFSYHCNVCHVHYHSLCLLMPFTQLHAFHPHQLYMRFSSPYGAGQGFRCDICGNPGFDHWLYRCDHCEFDAHLHCAKTSNASSFTQGSSNQAPQDPPLSMITTRSVNFRSPPDAPSSNVNAVNVPIGGAPPPGYPSSQGMNPQPANPTGQGQPTGPYVSTNPPTFVSPGPYPGINIHPAPPVGVGQPQAPIHPQQNLGAVPGAGPGGFLMAGVAAGAAQGIGQEIVQSATHGLGLGNES